MQRYQTEANGVWAVMLRAPWLWRQSDFTNHSKEKVDRLMRYLCAEQKHFEALRSVMLACPIVNVTWNWNIPH